MAKTRRPRESETAQRQRVIAQADRLVKRALTTPVPMARVDGDRVIVKPDLAVERSLIEFHARWKIMAVAIRTLRKNIEQTWPEWNESAVNDGALLMKPLLRVESHFNNLKIALRADGLKRQASPKRGGRPAGDERLAQVVALLINEAGMTEREAAGHVASEVSRIRGHETKGLADALRSSHRRRNKSPR